MSKFLATTSHLLLDGDDSLNHEDRLPPSSSLPPQTPAEEQMHNDGVASSSTSWRNPKNHDPNENLARNSSGPTSSLFRMTMESPRNDSNGTFWEPLLWGSNDPPLPPPPLAITSLPPKPPLALSRRANENEEYPSTAAFYPVDEYTEFSLRELLEMSDDFLWETNEPPSSHELRNNHETLSTTTPLKNTSNYPTTTTSTVFGLREHSTKTNTIPNRSNHYWSPVFPNTTASMATMRAAALGTPAVSNVPLTTKSTGSTAQNAAVTVVNYDKVSNCCTSDAATPEVYQDQEEEATNPKKSQRHHTAASLVALKPSVDNKEVNDALPPRVEDEDVYDGGPLHRVDHDKKNKGRITLPPLLNEARFRSYQSGQWTERFQDLLQYRQEFGHCSVPHTYKTNLPLAHWVKRQRYQYKLWQENMTSSTLTAERRQALEDIGFCWDSQGAAWGERLEELREFRRIHRHCNVPSNYSANPQLATWVKCQRRQYKLYQAGKPSNMSAARIQELANLGFKWLLRSYSKKKKPVSRTR